MKKHWSLIYISVFICLFSNPIFARSSFSLENRQLYIPVVYVGGSNLKVNLQFVGNQRFVLTSAQISTQSSDQPASYDGATGVVTIPYIDVASIGSAFSANLKLISSAPPLTFELTSLQQVSVLPPSDNTAPTAENISVRSDLTTPYIAAQLIGTDSDNDTLVYVLDAPYEGPGYQQAFVESNTGRFFATLRNDGVNEITFPYRVSDGQQFSQAATLTVTIGDIANGGLGSQDIPEDEYGRLQLAFFDGDRFGAAPGDPPALPTSVDLSGNFPTPGNQGQQGSCVGWATAYALKSFQEKIEEQWSFSEATLFSPAWVYNQINNGVDQGSSIEVALQLIIDRGAATLQTMPYDDGDYLTQPSNTAISEAASFKGIQYQRLNGVQQFKSALANKQPIVIGMIVYDSFQTLSGSNPVYNTISGNNLGGHAVTIVGYDDNQYGGALKIINSWGMTWGDNGFFWMPYDKVSDLVKYAFILTDGPNSRDTPVVPVVPVRDDLPNLQIANWSATYDPQPGGAGKVQWEIVNAGSSTAVKGADVNLMLSLDNHIDSSDWFLVYEEIPVDLQPGGSALRDETNPLTFEIPQTLPAGTYYMAVWVDDLQEIDESNEEDNQSFGSEQINITLPALPDLAIDYWWASWDNYSGSGVLEYTVINNGTSPTTRTDWDINLILSDNADPNNGNVYFLFYENSPFILAPGETVYRDASNQAYFNLFMTQFGYSVPSGVYYMSLWVDDLELENENNEINNLSTGSQLVSISNAFSSKAKPADGKPYSVASNFNGKRLPTNHMQMKKVEITERADGSRSITFLDDGTQQNAPKTSVQSDNRAYGKVMKAADYAVFPRSTRYRMGDPLEAGHDKE